MTEQEKMKSDQKMLQDKMIHEAQEADKTRDFTREEWDREDARKAADLTNKLEIERLRQDNIQSKFSQQGTPDNGTELESIKLQAEKIHKDYLAKMASLQETTRHNKATEEHTVIDLAIKKKQSNKPKA